MSLLWPGKGILWQGLEISFFGNLDQVLDQAGLLLSPPGTHPLILVVNGKISVESLALAPICRLGCETLGTRV